MMVESSIVWLVNPTRGAKTAHLFRRTGHNFVSWCSNAMVPSYERLLQVVPDSGFHLCKSCLKAAKGKLGIS